VSTTLRPWPVEGAKTERHPRCRAPCREQAVRSPCNARVAADLGQASVALKLRFAQGLCPTPTRPLPFEVGTRQIHNSEPRAMILNRQEQDVKEKTINSSVFLVKPNLVEQKIKRKMI
jgi:hypothetical protein